MVDYSPDEVSTVVGEIIRRAKGSMSDEDFKNFIEMVKRPVIGCQRCENTGIYTENNANYVCLDCNYHDLRGRRYEASKIIKR